MARSSNNNRGKSKPGGSRYAALAILVVIISVVGAYFFFSPARTVAPPKSSVVLKTPPPLHPQHRPSSSKKQLPVTPQKPEIHSAEKPLNEKRTPQARPESGMAELAIIIDDMGTTLHEAHSLVAIGVPLTFSIIPGLSKYREVGAFATASGVEIMIHIPMQSKGWPGRRLESNGLLVSMSDSDITERVEGFTRLLPNAVGANNHTGSEFTEHEDKMRVVLEALKGKGLYFVDSVTAPKTVGGRLAKELGLKSGRRNVFLDNEQNEAYILGQLNQAVRLAKKTGAAIAICHPHPATIRTLQAALPGLAKQGIALVTVSRLVK